MSGMLALLWLGYGGGLVVAGGEHTETGIFFLCASFVSFVWWLWTQGVRVVVREQSQGNG